MIKNYFVKSIFWGSSAKIIQAIVQFVSVPILLNYFGREDYGLIALAIAVNAYLQLLDLGINTGAIKYFSAWIATDQRNLLERVFRTSISFYLIVGLLNAIALGILAFAGLWMFSLSADQELVFRELLLILAIFSIFNWATSVFNQLLIANEQIAYVQKALTIRSFLLLFSVFLTIYLKLELKTYFFLYIIINSFSVTPYFYIKIKKSKLIKKFTPAFYWIDFKEVLKYSLAILAMGLFQLSAVKLRPLILGIFSNEGVGIVSDYQILETITLLIISISGVVMSSLLPKTSRLWIDKNQENIERFVYTGTKYTSILSIILSMPIMLCSNEILEIYVGKGYLHLGTWLTLWVFAILISIHNTPAASLVLATGKTKALVYSSAIACVVSLILNALLSPYLGVGAAIVGYFVYIIIQMSFYYLYFNKKVLHLDSLKVFKQFAKPTLMALFIAIFVWLLNIKVEVLFVQLLIKCILWFVLFILALFVLNIVKIEEVKELVITKK